jgi:hypothetical protein
MEVHSIGVGTFGTETFMGEEGVKAAGSTLWFQALRGPRDTDSLWLPHTDLCIGLEGSRYLAQ